jgi:magnesium transporter
MGLFRSPKPPPGHRLGSLAVEPDNLPTRITVLCYNASRATERTVATIADLRTILAPSPEDSRVHWVLVQGLGDGSTLHALGEVFALDPLTVEDLIESHQRPKADWVGDRLLTVLRAPWLTPQQTVELDQIGLMLGPGYLLTVQETHSALLQGVWDRILRGHAGIRAAGAPALAHAVIDQITDSFYPVLEEIGDRLEQLEDRVMEASDDGILDQANQVRSDLIRLRRLIWPQREAIQRIARNEMQILPAEFEAPFRGTYEHCLQTSEIIESYRELVGAINGTYLSAVSNRTNEVMRVLTIMASIFIPLTFIAGIYGMNFEHMPELANPYGYPAVWLVMISVAAAMLLFFRRKGWIRFGRSSTPRHTTDS